MTSLLRRGVSFLRDNHIAAVAIPVAGIIVAVAVRWVWSGRNDGDHEDFHLSFPSEQQRAASALDALDRESAKVVVDIAGYTLKGQAVPGPVIVRLDEHLTTMLLRADKVMTYGDEMLIARRREVIRGVHIASKALLDAAHPPEK